MNQTPPARAWSQPLILVPAVITAAAAGLLAFCAWRGEPFNVSAEDGLLEWSTVYFLLVCAIAAIAALVANRRRLARPQRWFLVVLTTLLLLAVGEELSWGQRLLDLSPPEALAANEDNLIQVGHGDITLHNLSFKSKYLRFSVGGVLLGVVLITGIFVHGVWLPRAIRRDDKLARWFVDRMGVFVPAAQLGALMFAAALVLHFLKPLELTESREYKEFVIALILAFMLVQAYFSSDGRASRAATGSLLAAVGVWIAASVALLLLA